MGGCGKERPPRHREQFLDCSERQRGLGVLQAVECRLEHCVNGRNGFVPLGIVAFTWAGESFASIGNTSSFLNPKEFPAFGLMGHAMPRALVATE